MAKQKESNGTEDKSKAQFTLEQKRKFGPVANRSCTDILCLLLFVIFLAVWGYMIVYFYRYVDIERTLNPSDIYGNVCGKGKFKDKKYLVFFNIFTCALKFESSIIDGCQTPQVCVENCPNITFSINAAQTGARQKEAENAICLYGIKPTAGTILDLVQEGKCAQFYFNSDPVGGRCLPSVLKMLPGSADLIMDELTGSALESANQTLITADEVLHNNQVIATLMKALALGTKIANDIALTWQWILIGLVLSMIVAFFWIFLMQWLTRYMVWFSILTIFALNVLGVYYSLGEYQRLSRTSPNNATDLIVNNVTTYQALMAQSENPYSAPPQSNSMKYIRAGSLESNGLQFDLDVSGKLKDELESYRNNKTTWLVLLITLSVILGIISLLLFCLFKRISLAIAVIEEASKAVNTMKSTLFFPIIPYILKVVVLGGWLGAVIIIASGSHPQYRFPNDTLCVPEHLSPEHQKHIGASLSLNEHPDFVDDSNCTFKRPFTRDLVYGAHAFNLFAVIWVLFFVMGVCYVTLSGAFASYYWTLHKEDVPFFALLGSFYRCIRFHMGSVAFGSLLVAIVRFIRIILEFIDKKCKKYADNIVARAIMCCLKCCFWCLENFIKFINKNAFIMIAIYGKNFCASARDAFGLLLSNGMRAIVLNCLSDFLIFLSKLAVTGLVGVGAFFVLTNRAEFLVRFDSLNYYWAPLAIFVILSYIVTSTFFNVYDVAIETIFMCYLEDCKENDGSRERPYFMAKNLAKTLDSPANSSTSLSTSKLITTKSLSKSLTMSSIYPIPYESK